MVGCSGVVPDIGSPVTRMFRILLEPPDPMPFGLSLGLVGLLELTTQRIYSICLSSAFGGEVAEYAGLIRTIVT